jgi:hypothetical protein
LVVADFARAAIISLSAPGIAEAFPADLGVSALVVHLTGAGHADILIVAGFSRATILRGKAGRDVALDVG